MKLGSGPVPRFVAVAAVALALILAGILVGSRIGPRVVTVERRIIAPAIREVQPGGKPAVFVDPIRAACPAVVAIEDSGMQAAAGAETAAPAATRHGHRRRRAAATATPALPPRAAGFIVSPTGYLVTSAAAISKAGTIHVHLNDGRVLLAQRANVDDVSGLALLKIDGTDFPTLEYASSGFPQLGDVAVALAAPNGTGCVAQPVMISADFLAEGGGRRAYARLFPAAGLEFAGGPVIDSDGRVIGVAGVAPASSRQEDASKLLPAMAAASITTVLLRGDGRTSPYGLLAVDIDGNLADRLADAQQGAVVMLVQEGSPADRAGLKAGDVVLAADGSPISGATELARALDSDEPAVTLDVLRQGNKLHLIVPRAGAGSDDRR